MNTSTLSRRGFIATAGSMTVGFSLAATVGQALARPPAGQLAIDSWLKIGGGRREDDDTVVTIYAGRVELGTGVQTALTQMVAEELFVNIEQVAYVQGDTDLTPGSQTYTAGSKTVQREGPPLRNAAATALQTLLAMAASQLGVPVASLRAREGRIGVGKFLSRGKSYAQLIGAQTLAVTTPATVATKAPVDFTIVGTSVPRVDLPDKFTAQFQYTTDVRVPGMLHARVLRPSGRNASFVSLNASAAAAVPGFVRVVQQGNLVAVLATDEYAAVQAAKLVTVSWAAGAPMIPQASLPAALQDPANVYAKGNEVDLGNVDSALATAGATLSATYFTPFHMHGAMGASCAVADVDVANNKATVWSGTQGPFPLRAALAVLLGLPEPNIRVVYVEASGCYGHNGADDVSGEAALISKLVGKPVRLQWTRTEEHRWEPLGPAMLHKMRGGVTGASVVAWEHALYSPTHNTRPSGGAGAGNLLVAQQTGLAPADAPALNTNTASRNAPVTYNFSNNRLIRNWVKSFNLVPGTLKAALPLTYALPRSTALRSLGGLSNSFANECFMDELARKANADPLAFRLAHSTDPRAIAVLRAVADKAGWGGTLPAQPVGFAIGRGIAFLRYETVEAYVATVAEVVVNKTTGEVKVQRVVVAHDCGQVINPDGLRHQIEGNVIQGVSRTLKEQVDYAGDNIRNNGWADYAPFFQIGYPVIQFDEVPAIEIVLIDRPEEVPWGAGEPVIGSLPGAIGNAIFNAVGARVRTLPMRPATVLAAM